MYGRDAYTFANHASIPSSIVSFITTLLKSWDSPSSSDAYLSVFKADGVLYLDPTPAKGRDAIKALRGAMINPTKGPVVGVQHYFDRVFTLFDTDGSGRETQVMFNGCLTYELKNGDKVTSDFATLVVLVQNEDGKGELQADFLRVYTDSTALKEGVRRMMAVEEG